MGVGSFCFYIYLWNGNKIQKGQLLPVVQKHPFLQSDFEQGDHGESDWLQVSGAHALLGIIS